MSNKFKYILIGVLATSALIVLAANGPSAYAASADRGANVLNLSASYAGAPQLAAVPASDLNTEEAAGLLFMREEEKLARDVYNQMYTLWGQRIFQNIAASEQTHMDQIGLLLDRYGLTDPAQGPGQFTDASLQALYDQLIAQGSVSLEEALKVGVLIEQTDINDLQTRLTQTDNADIKLVYSRLLNASNQHLKAFTGSGQMNGTGIGRGGSGRRFQSGRNTP